MTLPTPSMSLRTRPMLSRRCKTKVTSSTPTRRSLPRAAKDVAVKALAKMGKPLKKATKKKTPAPKPNLDSNKKGMVELQALQVSSPKKRRVVKAKRPATVTVAATVAATLPTKKKRGAFTPFKKNHKPRTSSKKCRKGISKKKLQKLNQKVSPSPELPPPPSPKLDEILASLPSNFKLPKRSAPIAREDPAAASSNSKKPRLHWDIKTLKTKAPTFVAAVKESSLLHKWIVEARINGQRPPLGCRPLLVPSNQVAFDLRNETTGYGGFEAPVDQVTTDHWNSIASKELQVTFPTPNTPGFLPKHVIFTNPLEGRCESHIDQDHVMLGVMEGRKEIWLAPPSLAPKLAALDPKSCFKGSHEKFTYNPFEHPPDVVKAQGWQHIVVRPGEAFLIPCRYIHCVKSDPGTVGLSSVCEVHGRELPPSFRGCF